jgi:hypothetical protein
MCVPLLHSRMGALEHARLLSVGGGRSFYLHHDVTHLLFATSARLCRLLVFTSLCHLAVHPSSWAPTRARISWQSLPRANSTTIERQSRSGGTHLRDGTQNAQAPIKRSCVRLPGSSSTIQLTTRPITAKAACVGQVRWSVQILLHAGSVNLDLFVTHRLCGLHGPCADTTQNGVGRSPPEWPKEAPKQELPDCPADPRQRHSCEFDHDPRGDARPIRGKFILQRRWNQGCLRCLASLVTRDCISTRFSCFARWTSPHDL